MSRLMGFQPTRSKGRSAADKLKARAQAMKEVEKRRAWLRNAKAGETWDEFCKRTEATGADGSN